VRFHERSIQAKLVIPVVLGGCLGGLSALLPGCAPKTSISAPQPIVRRSPIPRSATTGQLRAKARAIAVKILGTDFLGTGFVVKKQGEIYTIITNAHVLRAGKFPYRLQMSDGRIYAASIPKNLSFQGNDLALLQFRSPRISYPVSTLAPVPPVGQEVFAAGFVLVDAESSSSAVNFRFTTGKVSFLLPKALEGGYQVGYTNEIEKGMSGGPLLNRRGEVVGVNGKHAYPLWDSPSTFADGSSACPPLHQLINRFSWAIPIKTVLKLAPPSVRLSASSNPSSIGQISNPTPSKIPCPSR
jgi:S1-C subfamily serine protease